MPRLSKKYPFYPQLDIMDCGPTCLRMIARFYGKSYSLSTLRARTYATRQGVSMLGISEAAESIGFRTMGARLSLQQLIEDMPIPCILHWKQNHFVVCYKVIKQRKGCRFLIGDPAFDLITYSEAELKSGWISTKKDNATVSQGEVLFKVVPLSAPCYFAKSSIGMQHIGEVFIGQQVVLHFEDLLGNDDGYLKGEVIYISSFPTEKEEYSIRMGINEQDHAKLSRISMAHGAIGSAEYVAKQKSIMGLLLKR